MKIVWNKQSIRWFRAASEYTGYHKKLAKILLEYIADGDSLCDLGCGIGLIDMELAPHVRDVTCVDISGEALCAAEQNAADLGYGNVKTLCADVADVCGEWDTVTALFFCGDEVAAKYAHLAKKQMILVVHGSREGGFGPEGHKVSKRFDTNSVRKQLDERKIRYSFRETSLEYGQPLTSWEDAKAFTAAYSEQADPEQLDVYLRENLQKTNDERFPYYLPNRKRLGIFVIKKELERMN